MILFFRFFPLPIILALAACALPLNAIVPTPEPTLLPETLATQTFFVTDTHQPIPTSTATSTEVPTLTVTASPTPFTPFEATITVDHVNLRSNPGYLFTIHMQLDEGASIRVLGKAPGGEWISVQTQDGLNAWVFTKLLQSANDLSAVPVIEPQNVQLLKGRLVNELGEPVSGVQFAITQGEGDHPLRNDAMTDAEGYFYAFMPVNSSGGWTVAYTAIACTSNLMDASCNYKDGTAGQSDPATVNITLPYNEVLLFTWK